MTPEKRNQEGALRPLVYTIEEAAKLLKVSKWTLYRLIEEGELGSILIRRRRLVRASDITAFIDRQIATPPEVQHGC